jgi:hypothetical protein
MLIEWVSEYCLTPGEHLSSENKLHFDDDRFVLDQHAELDI